MPYSRKSPKYSKKNKSQKAGSKTKRVKSQKAGSKTKRVKSQKAGANGNNNKLSTRERLLKQQENAERMLQRMRNQGLLNNSNNESENETGHPCYGNKDIHVEPGCQGYPDFMTGQTIPDQNGLCVRDNCYSRRSLQQGRLHHYIPTQEHNWTRSQQGLEAGSWMNPLTREVYPRSFFEGLGIPSPESNTSFQHDDEYRKAVEAYLATLKTQQDFAALGNLMARRFKTAEGLRMERGGKK